MELILYEPARIAADVVRFWRERIAAQDPALALTRSPEWFEMMLASQPRGGVVAAFRDDAGRLKAVLPVIFREWVLRGRLAGRDGVRRTLLTAKVCGGDLLEESLTADELAWAWQQFVQQRPAVDAFWLDHVEDGPRLDLVRASCRGRAFFAHPLLSDAPHYRLKLKGVETGLRDWRSRKSLARLQTKERALARDVGPVHVLELRQPADWVSHAAAIEALMNHAWQAKLLGHKLRMDDQRPVAERGWLRSFLLLAGERPAAFVLCYQGMGTLFYEQLGYAQELGRYSPGAVLLYRVIERVLDTDTPDYIDFGEGEAEYKQSLANDVVQTNGLLVVRATPALRLTVAAARTLGRADRALRAALRGLGLQRWIWKKLKQG